MCLPQKKICLRCGRPFETTTEGQDECLPCMIRPSRCNVDDEQKQAAPVSSHTKTVKTFKEKVCACGKSFIPTGPCQKRCRECIESNTTVAATMIAPPAFVINSNAFGLTQKILNSEEPGSAPEPNADLSKTNKETLTVKNKLTDLNNHLFAQLERLSDETIVSEKLASEIERSRAVSQVASNIIANAKIILEAHVAAREWNLGTSLPMIEAVPVLEAVPGAKQPPSAESK